MRNAGVITSLAWGAGALADLLWPRACAACNDPGPDGPLCDACSTDLLTLVAAGYCQKCGVSLGPNVPRRDDGCGMCPHVLPRFRQVIRLGPYAGALRSIVRGLKFHRDVAIAGTLTEMLAQRIATECDVAELDLVLGVPMHWRRRLMRGCDAAALLAAGLARRLKLPLGDELLRVRHTPLQTSLSRTARIENVRDAFSLRNGAALEGVRVLLVDDVTTTGATADEAARTLKAGGAARVTLAVVAKTEGQRTYHAPDTQAKAPPTDRD